MSTWFVFLQFSTQYDSDLPTVECLRALADEGVACAAAALADGCSKWSALSSHFKFDGSRTTDLAADFSCALDLAIAIVSV